MNSLIYLEAILLKASLGMFWSILKAKSSLEGILRFFKRIYCPNDCREEVKGFLRSLRSLARDLLGRGLVRYSVMMTVKVSSLEVVEWLNIRDIKELTGNITATLR